MGVNVNVKANGMFDRFNLLHKRYPAAELSITKAVNALTICMQKYIRKF